MLNATAFYETYVRRLGAVEVVEIGSQNVNGSIREVFEPPVSYVGVDFQSAPGVDVVLDDPYVLPFADGSVDVVVTSSCFEHSDFFWLTFCEIARITRPGGLIYINVPSNGPVHAYPIDSWRFYPDAGRSLAKWATRQGVPVVMLESFTTVQNGGCFNDFVAVFERGEQTSGRHANRIIPNIKGFDNGYLGAVKQPINPQTMPEDQRTIYRVKHLVADRLKELDAT